MRQLSRRQLLQSTAAGLVLPALPKIIPAMDQPVFPHIHPRIAKFEQLAFGIFVHFGLYSLVGKGEWTMFSHGTPRDEYMKLMSRWSVPDFSGQKLAQLAKSAGAKYVTLTSRHHDGFSLYDTHGLSKWDVTKTPARRDIIRDFVDGCRSEGIVPCLYHTTLDWSDDRFKSDWKGYQQYLRDSVEIICSNYGELGAVWFDGNWSKPEADWELDALYSMIRKLQPETMIINNTGIGEEGKLVHSEIDAVTFERGRATRVSPNKLTNKYITGEMCHTANYHWGIATRDFNMLSPASVIEELCRARAVEANFLMNLGPTGTGAIPDYEQAMFEVVGKWVDLHGGSNNPIYRGKPKDINGEDDDFGLIVNNEAYLFIFDLTATADPRASGTNSRGPGPRKFTGLPPTYVNARWLDSGEELKLEHENGSSVLHATKYPYGTNTVVRIAHLTQ
ncbi:MAG: alpha-L-fucosidase [Fimbriimonadaceae bacterium]|nr:MAG: alpha-L-fucosidase [Fimbriimonadaceae bacterium]